MSQQLPLPWVDSLFAQLAIKYGRAFKAQYEGLDAALVKADWARELGGYFVQVEPGKYDAPAITWALDNLVPGRPPTALEFRAICRRYDPPRPLAIAHDSKPPDPRFRQALARLAEPSEDKRPTKVRAAARFVSMWGTPGVRLSPMKKEWLDYSREVLAQYERELERELREAGFEHPSEFSHG